MRHHRLSQPGKGWHKIEWMEIPEEKPGLRKEAQIPEVTLPWPVHLEDDNGIFRQRSRPVLAILNQPDTAILSGLRHHSVRIVDDPGLVSALTEHFSR